MHVTYDSSQFGQLYLWLFLIGVAMVFVIQVAIVRWIFRVNRIIELLERIEEVLRTGH
jgi:hypothetical protein